MRAIQFLVLAGVLSFPALGLADGDPEKGEKVFRKCQSCHEVGPEARDKSGPALNGILGAAAGRSANFKYSSTLLDAASKGLIWDENSLAAFLKKPREFLKGTKMSFSGLRKDADVDNLIAFLKQQ